MPMLMREEVRALSVSERIQLVEDIWDTVVETPNQVLLTDEQKVELDRRLDAYHQDPEDGDSWDVVKVRIGNHS